MCGADITDGQREHRYDGVSGRTFFHLKLFLNTVDPRVANALDGDQIDV